MDHTEFDVRAGQFSREQLDKLSRTPEWMAIYGMITAEEYLTRSGYPDQPIEMIAHGLSGRPKPK